MDVAGFGIVLGIGAAAVTPGAVVLLVFNIIGALVGGGYKLTK